MVCVCGLLLRLCLFVYFKVRVIIFLFFLFVLLKVIPRALCIVGKGFFTESLPQLNSGFSTSIYWRKAFHPQTQQMPFSRPPHHHPCALPAYLLLASNDPRLHSCFSLFPTHTTRSSCSYLALEVEYADDYSTLVLSSTICSLRC